jgi:hypothetical protein
MKKSFVSVAVLVFGLCMMMPSASALAGYATIVVDATTGSWGSAYSPYDFSYTDQQALNNCGAGCDNPYGTDKIIYQRAENGWASVATNGSGRYATAGVHDSQYDAEQSALANCGESSCYILRSLYSY